MDIKTGRDMVQSGCSDAVTLCLLVENKGLLGRVHKFFDQKVLYFFYIGNKNFIRSEKTLPSAQIMHLQERKDYKR